MLTKMFKYKITTATFFLALLVYSQQGTIPLLEAPASAQSLSMGGTTMGQATQAFIYSNPTAIFRSPTSLNVDYSTALLPTEDKTMHLHTLSSAYKHNNNAFFVGARYFSMGSITDSWDSQGNPIRDGNKIDFYSYGIDLGYAYKINNSLVAYTKVGMANEKVMSDIQAYHSSFGVFYNGQIKQSLYSLGLEVANLGIYKYKDKSKSLSPLVKLGGSIVFETFNEQRLEVATNYGVYLPVEDYKSKSHFNMGLDYSFFKKYSLRMGAHTGEQNDYASAGVGVKFKSFAVNLGSKIALRSDLENMYMIDLNYSL